MSAARRPFWLAAAPVAFFVGLVCFVLWRTPFPLTEAVAIFEDVVNYPFSRFLIPDTSYYRPLFHLTIAAIWNGAPTLETRLALVKVIHVVATAVLFVGIFAWMRPRSARDGAAAVIAAAVLGGSPGFEDNLELPLSYSLVGMATAVLVWLLVERQPARWGQVAIVLLTMVAVGFKEQGLIIRHEPPSWVVRTLGLP